MIIPCEKTPRANMVSRTFPSFGISLMAFRIRSPRLARLSCVKVLKQPPASLPFEPIRFVTRQMNVPVEGAFRKFDATVAFDPANGICATDAYLRVAIGLDYLDAAPVRGARRGGGAEHMVVEVHAAASPIPGGQ